MDDGADERLHRALAATPHRTGWLSRGYAVAEVDEFLEYARRACAGRPPQLTAQRVRGVGFRLVPGGYDITATDAVLTGIEDALAGCERRRALAGSRRQEWLQSASALAEAVLARAQRPAGTVFPRGRGLERGYHRGDVDRLCRLLVEHFAGRRVLTPEEVRGALFRPRRGRRGYREVPVDAFFDRVVELLCALGPPPGRS